MIKFLLDYSSGMPIYRQIIDQIRFGIASGQLKLGEQLPNGQSTCRRVKGKPKHGNPKLIKNWRSRIFGNFSKEPERLLVKTDHVVTGKRTGRQVKRNLYTIFFRCTELRFQPK